MQLPSSHEPLSRRTTSKKTLNLFPPVARNWLADRGRSWCRRQAGRCSSHVSQDLAKSLVAIRPLYRRHQPSFCSLSSCRRRAETALKRRPFAPLRPIDLSDLHCARRVCEAWCCEIPTVRRHRGSRAVEPQCSAAHSQAFAEPAPSALCLSVSSILQAKHRLGHSWSMEASLTRHCQSPESRVQNPTPLLKRSIAPSPRPHQNFCD